MIKAVLFDFDGTLADTLPVCFSAFQTVFKEFDNVSVTTDQIRLCLDHLKQVLLEKI